jgi:hypothetical protein
MGMNQVTEDHSKKFIAEHAGHNLRINIASTMDFGYRAEFHDGLIYAGERLTEDWVEDTGFYLNCDDCAVEQEINMSDVITD